MTGRKPKPTAVKKPEGNPGKRKLNKKEPATVKRMLECPDWLLPEAKAEWGCISISLAKAVWHFLFPAMILLNRSSGKYCVNISRTSFFMPSFPLHKRNQTMLDIIPKVVYN